MGKKLIFILVFICSAFFASAQKIDRKAFYQAMSSGNLEDVNEQISLVSAKDNDAYEGALLMRKAGLVSKPKDKLHFFKTGRVKFQAMFEADSNNTEYRFLRLSIQEHAPKIVKYRSNIHTDKDFIISHFKTLPLVVQQAITEYSKTSKVLRPQDL